MYSPKYLVQLDKNLFQQNDTACLGAQLLDILDKLEKVLPEHTWLGADVNVNNCQDVFVEFEKFQLSLIGDIKTFKSLLAQVNQFMSGVFIAAKSRAIDKIARVEAGTEDPMFRPLELNGILLEIRAFDTSYFEFYSSNLEIIRYLSFIYPTEFEELT